MADQKPISFADMMAVSEPPVSSPFAAAKLGAEMIPGLLASIRKATSATNNYKRGGAK